MMTAPPPDTATSLPGVNASWTVNEVLALHPSVGRVLNAFGVDTCCGGGDTLALAAARARIGPELLIEAVGDVLRYSAAKGQQ